MNQFVKKIIKKLIRDLLIYLIPPQNNEGFPYKKAESILQKHYPNVFSTPIGNNRIHEKTYDLTVIVPVYNVEKYLKTCMDSLLNQKTQYSYHVIAVNDGATDGSENILNAYSDWLDLMVIKQKNKGLSGARNTGLQYVYGKYIMFVDSDDYLPENAIESLMQAAYLQNAEIVQGGYIHVSEDGQKCFASVKYSNTSNVAPNGTLAGMAWGKVYKAELFSEIRFPEGYWYEDSIITGIITHLASNIATTSDNVYFYRKNAAGITNISRGKPKSVDTFYVLRSTMNARKQLNMHTDCAFYEHLLRIIPVCAQRIKNEPEIVQKAMFSLIKKMLEEERGMSGFNVHFQYKLLETVILCGDFRRYRLLCAVL